MNVHSKNKPSPKRDQILAAALRLVSQHGFHGTSMSMLAAEADCGQGTIYNYFSGKEELLEALFRQLKSEFVAAILDGDTNADALEVRFKRMWKNIILYFIGFPDRAAYFQQYHSSPYYSVETDGFIMEVLQPLLMVYTDAMQRGEIRNLPQPVLESLTIDLAISLARRHGNGEIELTDALIEETGEACWQSLKGCK
jgi:AcrR family transcriptional regulator